MDLYSIRNQRISPNEEFPLLCFRSARAWHSLLAERHTEKNIKKKGKSHPVLSGLVQIGFVQRKPFHDNNDHSLNTLYIWFFAKGRLSGLATILMD